MHLCIEQCLNIAIHTYLHICRDGESYIGISAPGSASLLVPRLTEPISGRLLDGFSPEYDLLLLINSDLFTLCESELFEILLYSLLVARDSEPLCSTVITC